MIENTLLRPKCLIYIQRYEVRNYRYKYIKLSCDGPAWVEYNGRVRELCASVKYTFNCDYCIQRRAKG